MQQIPTPEKVNSLVRKVFGSQFSGDFEPRIITLKSDYPYMHSINGELGVITVGTTQGGCRNAIGEFQNPDGSCLVLYDKRFQKKAEVFADRYKIEFGKSPIIKVETTQDVRNESLSEEVRKVEGLIKRSFGRSFSGLYKTCMRDDYFRYVGELSDLSKEDSILFSPGTENYRDLIGSFRDPQGSQLSIYNKGLFNQWKRGAEEYVKLYQKEFGKRPTIDFSRERVDRL